MNDVKVGDKFLIEKEGVELHITGKRNHGYDYIRVVNGVTVETAFVEEAVFDCNSSVLLPIDDHCEVIRSVIQEVKESLGTVVHEDVPDNLKSLVDNADFLLRELHKYNEDKYNALRSNGQKVRLPKKAY